MRLLSRVGCFVVLGFVAVPGSAHAYEKMPSKPQKGVLFRIDVSAVGTFNQDETSVSVDVPGGDPEQVSVSSNGIAVGPKLLLNLGYAPSRLVRLGVYGAVEGAPQFTVNTDTPNLTVDGHFRFSAGPTLGLRFGPEAPLELEFGLGIVRQEQVGSQSEVLVQGNTYPLGADHWGGEGGIKLLLRPGGAADTFAIHVGVLGGLTVASTDQAETKAFLGGIELGISLGL
jgi:hypothetical protein